MRPVFFWCKSYENGQLNYYLSSCHEIRFDNKPSIKIGQKPEITEQFEILQEETIKVDHETIDLKFIPPKVKFAIDWLSVGHENFECSDRKLARLKGKKPCCQNWKQIFFQIIAILLIIYAMYVLSVKLSIEKKKIKTTPR